MDHPAIGSRVPVEIVPLRTPDGRVVRAPRVLMEDAIRSDLPRLPHRITEVQQSYEVFLGRCRVVLAEIAQQKTTRKRGRVDPRLCWALGDLICTFLHANETSAFYIDGVKRHVCRDLGLSSSTWTKVVRLRKLLPRVDLVDPRRNWEYYRDAPSDELRRLGKGAKESPTR